MTPRCKICGRQADYATPLMLVMVGDPDPAWLCLNDLMGYASDSGSIT